jgi:uncharacterized protein YoxC
MVVQIEIGIVAVALIVLVAFVVPVLTRLRRASAEAERLLKTLNGYVPALLQGANNIIRTTNGAVWNLKQGTAGFQGLGAAIGAIGMSLDHVHQSLRNGTGRLACAVAMNAAGLLVGIRASLQTLKERETSPPESCARSYASSQTERETRGLAQHIHSQC